MIQEKKRYTALLALYLFVFVFCAAGLFFVQKENTILRNIMGFFVYGTGFPLFIAYALLFLEKKGWLK